MLKIRPEQMAAFQPVADEMFIGRVVEHLREKYADRPVWLPGGDSTVKQLPDATLREMVRGGVARARGYGMTDESSLAAFVAIMVRMAPNFDRHPLLERMLKDGQVAPDARVEHLLKQATKQNWEAVIKGYDPAAWGLKA
jgi:hypothetical protein